MLNHDRPLDILEVGADEFNYVLDLKIGDTPYSLVEFIYLEGAMN